MGILSIFGKKDTARAGKDTAEIKEEIKEEVKEVAERNKRKHNNNFKQNRSRK